MYIYTHMICGIAALASYWHDAPANNMAATLALLIGARAQVNIHTYTHTYIHSLTPAIHDRMSHELPAYVKGADGVPFNRSNLPPKHAPAIDTAGWPIAWGLGLTEYREKITHPGEAFMKEATNAGIFVFIFWSLCLCLSFLCLCACFMYALFFPLCH